MTLNEQYRATLIKDMPETDCKKWVMDEIVELANDFGQRIDTDLLQHTAKRVYSELRTRYRSWAAGSVHAAFQLGMSGAYGTVHKVTVQRLFVWLKSAQQQKAVKTAFISANESRIAEELAAPKNNDYGSFICWLTINKIWIDDLIPGFKVDKYKRPTMLVELAQEFTEAREMNLLPALKRRLFIKINNE